VTIYIKTLLIMMLAAVASGCATVGDSTRNNSSQVDTVKVQYKVKAGDSLSDIALKLTGDVSNWERLAGYNKIAKPESLKAGQTIFIPSELLDGALIADKRLRNARATQTVQHSGNVPSTLPVTTGNGVSVARSAPVYDDGSADVAVFPVNFNRSFNLQPLSLATSAGGGALRYASRAPQVRVAGTYYPKGIYAQPVSYARLLIRVSPGTVFQLHSVVNDWYKVITDDGIGYIRKSDSALVQ